MPNFYGTGPLKRGRAIGRGYGTCNLCDTGCQRRNLLDESKQDEWKQTD